MRYKLPTDKLVNLLVPHFLSGRRYVLFIQALVYPLKLINDWFVELATEKQLEARMTSQVMYFEWFLTYKFKKYFVDPLDTIYIKESSTIGVDLYHEYSKNGKPFTLWHSYERVITKNPDEEPREFYYRYEEKTINKVSFWVCVPEITGIEEQEFIYMLSYVVNTYKLAGTTYLIKIDTNEIEPNKRTV